MRSEAGHRFPSRLILPNKASHSLGDQFRWPCSWGVLMFWVGHGIESWHACSPAALSRLTSPSSLHQRYPYNERQWPRGRSVVHLAVLILCLLFPGTGISQDPGRAIPFVGQIQWQEREEKKKKARCAWLLLVFLCETGSHCVALAGLQFTPGWP